MVKVSYQQKPYRRALMETFGATVYASPSDKTQSGRKILEEHPDSTGSLGIAIMPFKWNLLEGIKGVQLAEKGLESWEKRKWVEVPELNIE
jgi:hypothetical protein